MRWLLLFAREDLVRLRAVAVLLVDLERRAARALLRHLLVEAKRFFHDVGLVLAGQLLETLYPLHAFRREAEGDFDGRILLGAHVSPCPNFGRANTSIVFYVCQCTYVFA